MRLARSTAPRDRRCAGVVLVGNGQRDLRILEALVRRVRGDKTLCNPQITRAPGLLGLAKALSLLLHAGSPVANYILMVDLEHAGENSLQKLCRQLAAHGIRCREEEDRLTCRHGQRTFKVYLTVMGSSNCSGIEWNLARLITLEYRTQPSCSKEELRRWMRRNKMHEAELIRSARYSSIKEAFKPLLQSLEQVSGDP